jgi:hypothetical protein
MTQDVMLALLNRASNGEELLAVLDTFTEDVSVESDTNYMPILDQNVPTLESIAF